MTTVVRTAGLTKRFGDVTAVDDVTAGVEEFALHGLLGRNGAGKTTLLHLVSAQAPPTSGEVEVFGAPPWENDSVLQRVCFVREGQKYPDSWTPRQFFRAASWFYADWDPEFAAHLVSAFDLPETRRIAKLSRGQLSAVGVIAGLASRAPLTIFDEPYLGLDAVARSLFYDTLLADWADHPRTVIVSTHLIDEIAHLLSHVLVIDRGRVILDADAESLRGAAVQVAGTAEAVNRVTAGRAVTHRRTIGGLATATVTGGVSEEDRRAAIVHGLDITPVPLQQLVVDTTLAGADAREEGTQ
jgi:ABC-2 type transport system ATP-binding protein